MGGDTLRLLARNALYGYTDRPDLALPGEPEAIPADTQDDITARVHRTARQAQLDEWRERRRAIIRELDWLNSQRFQRDVATQVRALRRHLERIDRRL